MSTNPASSLPHLLCDPPGIPFPDKYPWGDYDLNRDHLAVLMSRAAVNKVLRAVSTAHEVFRNKAIGMAMAHLPPEHRERFRRIWMDAESLESWLYSLTIEVVALVASNPPRGFGVLDDMLRDALDDAGFCCEGAVDQFVADRGEWTDRMVGRNTGFKAEWLTLAGAREYDANQ